MFSGVRLRIIGTEHAERLHRGIHRVLAWHLVVASAPAFPLFHHAGMPVAFAFQALHIGGGRGIEVGTLAVPPEEADAEGVFRGLQHLQRDTPEVRRIAGERLLDPCASLADGGHAEAAQVAVPRLPVAHIPRLVVDRRVAGAAVGGDRFLDALAVERQSLRR